MSEEKEIRLYFCFYKISLACKKYFYNRKYLPREHWNIEETVESILKAARELKIEYHNDKKQGEE